MIELSPMGRTGFVCFFDKEGGTITNQTGGMACNHPIQTNVACIQSIELDQLVFDYFDIDGPYGGWCCDGMKEEDAEPLEKLIPGFKLDLEHLGISQEAWIYGFYNEVPCLLTFENSD